MKRYVSGGILIAIVGGIGYYGLFGSMKASMAVSNTEVPVRMDRTWADANRSAPEPQALQHKATAPFSSISAEDTRAPQSIGSPRVRLHPVEMAVIAQQVPPRQRVTPRGAFEIDPEILAALKPGEIFAIDDLDGQDYRIVIEGRSRMGDDVSLSGHVEDEGVRYPLLITTGASGSTYIHLETPGRTYEIELEDGRGYAYDTMAIRRALSDESREDFIVR